MDHKCLVDRDQIRASIKGAEVRSLEFKGDFPLSIAKHLVALANFGGGTIVFGIHEKDKKTGLRPPPTPTTMESLATEKAVEGLLKSARAQIEPSLRVEDPHDIKVDGTTLVVVEVPKPTDGLLRFFEGTAYTRVAGPESPPMKAHEVEEFYRRRYEDYVVDRQARLQNVLRDVLSEAAFSLVNSGRNTLEAWEVEQFARKVAPDETVLQAMIVILRSHDLLRWNGDSVRFASRDVLGFYTATYLSRLPVDELGRCLDDLRWDDVLKAAAKISPAPRAESLVSLALDKRRVVMALGLFLARPRDAIVSASVRDGLLEKCAKVLANKPEDYTRNLLLKEICDNALADHDDYFKLGLLQAMERARLPLSLLQILSVHARPSVELSQGIRVQVSRVLAEAKVEERDRREVLTSLMEALGEEEIHIPAREYLLLAISKHIKAHDDLLPQHWERINHQTIQCLSYVESLSTPNVEGTGSRAFKPRRSNISPVLSKALQNFRGVRKQEFLRV